MPLSISTSPVPYSYASFDSPPQSPNLLREIRETSEEIEEAENELQEATRTYENLKKTIARSNMSLSTRCFVAMRAEEPVIAARENLRLLNEKLKYLGIGLDFKK